MTVNPNPLADRLPVVTCAVTAATAEKQRPVAAQPAPNNRDPVTGSPAANRPAAANRPSTQLAPPTTRSAAVMGAALPTTPEPTSSSLPASSSARVWRTTSVTMRMDTSAAYTAVILIMDRAPRDVGS